MIDTFFHILKKMVVLTVFVIFGFAATYIPQPHINNVETANAAGAAFDPIDFPFDINNAVQTTINTVKSSWIWLKENVLDGIAWTIAKQIISNMVSSIVDWINSGFQGSPAFVQDLGGFLLQAADEAVGTYISELGDLGSFVCSPFRLDVQIAVALQYDLDRENDLPVCTLTGIIDNFEGFIDGTSRESTWDDWLKITSNPQNTPYGSILAAKSQTRARILNAEGEALTYTGWGSGFLSGELCQTATGANGAEEECFITKPGRVISDSLNKALGAGQDELVAADEFNEIVVALIGQLANQAITGASGLLGLSGGTGYTYTGYSRGSFAADLADGAINNNGSGGSTVIGSNPTDYSIGGNASARNLINDGLQSQLTVLSTVDTYIQDLTNFINNPQDEDDNIAFAQQALASANSLRTRVSTGVTSATPLLNTYDALETEYVTATPERRSEIRNEQTTLIQQFSTLNLLTIEEYNIYSAQWDTLLATNVGQTNPTNCSPAEIRTGQCNTGPGVTP